MISALVIGSGPAAAAAALALSQRSDLQITVIDLGVQLEHDRRAIVEELSTQAQDRWDPSKLTRISARPVDSGVKGLPEKRAYGSDFPFRDIRQLQGISSSPDVNQALVSGAYGGFSNVWGSQIMPFTEATFDTWPISATEMEPHYRAILGEVPLAGENDDLEELFPLIGTPTPLPSPSDRTARVLRKYAANRTKLARHGVTVGRARLAFEAGACIRCGLCMTGCPYSLIYSASTTIDRLRLAGRIAYLGDLLAIQVGEEDGRAFVWAQERGSLRLRRFEADRVYIACGAIGSTRIAAHSLGLLDVGIPLYEAAQFALPFFSLTPTTIDPRAEPQFTLNQFNMLVSPGGDELDLSLLHFYTYDPAFDDALPAFLRHRAARPARVHLLRRLSVALGYLPSWASPTLRLRVRAPLAEGGLPPLEIRREEVRWRENKMLRAVLARVARSARHLDLWPVMPYIVFSGGAKSYHFGGSFPHQEKPMNRLGTDLLGRIPPWERIHMIDAATFPNIPATTFTLSIMANAHRIASRSLDLY